MAAGKDRVAPGAYRAPDEAAEPDFDQANGPTGGASGEPEDRGHAVKSIRTNPRREAVNGVEQREGRA